LIFAVCAWSRQPETQKKPRLGIVCAETVPQPGILRTAMQAEVERLLPLPSLEICWLQMEEFRLGDVFNKVVVVKLGSQGKDCATLTRPPNVKRLGATNVADGVIIPFVELDVDWIHWLVGHSSLMSAPQPHVVPLGRALGRVLAHELYHVLADTKAHSRQGIAKAEMDPHDLVWSTEGFRVAELERIWKTAFVPSIKD